MGKNYLFLAWLFFFSQLASGQITPPPVNCGPDTILYPYLKELAITAPNDSFFIDAMVGNVRTASQAYHLNSPVNVRGVQFWGAAYSFTNHPQTMPVMVYLYSVDAFNMPVAKLDSAVVSITEEYDFYEVNFPNPHPISQNFAVAVRSLLNDTLAVVTNNAGNVWSQNYGEGLGWRRFGSGSWNSSQSFFGQDLEYMIFPIVDYNINALLDASPTTVTPGGTVNFTNNSSSILNNRFFNLLAFDVHWLGQGNTAFSINYGDNTVWTNTIGGTYTYPNAGFYEAKLAANMTGYFTNCSDTSAVQITVGQPNIGNSLALVTHTTCFGSADGAINLVPSGGTGPYTFDWGGGITTEDRSGLVAGNYTVVITDANGQTGTVTATVTQPDPVSGSTIVTNITSIGGSNGAIDLTPSGGTGPYTFNWGAGITTEDRMGLTQGTYTVLITDSRGCTGTVQATVGPPPQGTCAADTIMYPYLKELAITAPNDSFFIDAMVGNVRTASQAYHLNSPVNVRGVQFWGAAYSFTNHPQTMPVMVYLYSVDAFNMPVAKLDSAVVSITEEYDFYEVNFPNPHPISQNFAVAVRSLLNDTLAVVTNNAGNVWSQNYGEGLGWRRFGSGSWNSSQSFFGQDLEYMIFPIVDYNIHPTLAASNGTVCTGTPVNFSSSTSPIFTNRFFNLNAFDSYWGTGPGSSQFSVNYGDNTTWSAGLPGSYAYSNPGTYEVKLAVNMQGYYTNCQDTATTQVTVSDANFSASSVSVTDVSCFGETDGAIDLTPSGGVGPYSFDWGGGITSEDRSNLAAGTYTVTITDASGCSDNIQVIVNQPAAVVATAGSNSTVTVGGTLNLSASGGTSYTWTGPNGFTSTDQNPTIPGVTLANEGIYTVTVSDGACSATATTAVSVTAPSVLNGVYTINQDAPASATNFTSFTAAATALNTMGVSGPVTINVVSTSGPYTEQFWLGQIPGSSTTNTVTINGNQEELTFCGTVTNRDIIRLDGTDNVIINGLVLTTTCFNGWGIHVMGDVENVTLTNNTINLLALTSTWVGHQAGIVATNSENNPQAAGGLINGLTVSGNTITNGYYAIRLQSVSAAVMGTGVVVSNNTINQAVGAGIDVRNLISPTVTGNQITMAIGSAFQFKNSVGLIVIGAENGLTVTRNKVVNAGLQGMYLQNVNMTSTTRGMVANNMIGGGFQNANVVYAVQLNNASYLDVYHNSTLADNGAAGAGFYVSNQFSRFLNMQNNSFAFTGPGAGYALQANNGNANFTAINYNNYYSSGTSAKFVRFSGADRTSLAQLQIAPGPAGHNMQSDDENPLYINSTNLHLQAGSPLIGQGAALAQVTVDFDGDARATPTDIGADEYLVTVRTIAPTLEAAVYPNPFHNSLVVKVSGQATGDVQVVLTDRTGRQVLAQKFAVEAGVTALELNVEQSIAQGVYLLQVTQGEASAAYRVVKQ